MELVLLAGPYGQVMERLIALGCGVPISIGVILLGASWIVGSLRIARKGKMTVGQVVRIEKRWGDEPGGEVTAQKTAGPRAATEASAGVCLADLATGR